MSDKIKYNAKCQIIYIIISENRNIQKCAQSNQRQLNEKLISTRYRTRKYNTFKVHVCTCTHSQDKGNYFTCIHMK